MKFKFREADLIFSCVTLLNIKNEQKKLICLSLKEGRREDVIPSIHTD